jgi:hypothetical protein
MHAIQLHFKYTEQLFIYNSDSSYILWLVYYENRQRVVNIMDTAIINPVGVSSRAEKKTEKESSKYVCLRHLSYRELIVRLSQGLQLSRC